MADFRSRGIALVAHDSRKADLLDWARTHQATLGAHRLYGTGTTGSLLTEDLGLPVTALRSGHPHGDDVRALIRLETLANVPIACNRATADLIISSPRLAPAT